MLSIDTEMSTARDILLSSFSQTCVSSCAVYRSARNNADSAGSSIKHNANKAGNKIKSLF